MSASMTRREVLGMAAGAAACGVGIAAGVAQALPPPPPEPPPAPSASWVGKRIVIPRGEGITQTSGAIDRDGVWSVGWTDAAGLRWRRSGVGDTVVYGGTDGAECLGR